MTNRVVVAGLLLVLVSCSAAVRKPAATGSPSPSASSSIPAADRTIADLSFSDASHGWVLVESCFADCSSIVYATSDGGATWTPSTETGPGHELSHVVRATEQVGWIFGPELFETRDGGRTWRATGAGVIGMA